MDDYDFEEIEYGNEVNAHLRVAYYNDTNIKHLTKTEQFVLLLEQNIQLVLVKHPNIFDDVNVVKIKNYFSRDNVIHFNPKSIILASIILKNLVAANNLHDLSTFNIELNVNSVELVRSIKNDIKEFDSVDDGTILRDAMYLLNKNVI